jgi:hypothetical protein
MMLAIAPYAEQTKCWPQTCQQILAQVDDETIIVYQAYSPSIERLNVEKGYFGAGFKGPGYATDESPGRLRNRALGQKRSLALGKFALGIKGLERFVRKEPLRQVHDCDFGVLA